MRLIDKEMFDLNLENTLKSRLLLKTLFFSGILGLIGLLILGIFTYNSANSGFEKLSIEKLEVIASEVTADINSTGEVKANRTEELRRKINKKEKNYFKQGTGQIQILNKEGNLIVGKSGENTRNKSALVNKITQSDSNRFKYERNGTKMLAIYEYNSNLGWYVIVTDQLSTLTRFSTNVVWTMVISCIVAMILMGIGAVFVGNNITNPINKLVDTLKHTEQGDLTAKVDFADRDDELGMLGTSFNNMVDRQAEMINQVKEAVQTVTSSSEELSATIDETNQYIETTTSSITELTAGIQEVSSNAQSVSSSAQEMGTIVKEGDNAIEDAVNEMHVIRNTVEETAEVIKDLKGNSEEIGEIIELITNIAEQTNLLALNASVEAARAGEHGRGFAVVAEEIQSLAEETAEATDNIAELIKETQEGSQEAMDSIEKGTKEVAVGEEVIEQAGEAFAEIKEDIGETTRQIEDTSAATQQMASGADEVVNSTESISDMSGEINETSENLANEANKLKKLIEKFKV